MVGESEVGQALRGSMADAWSVSLDRERGKRGERGDISVTTRLAKIVDGWVEGGHNELAWQAHAARTPLWTRSG